MKMNQLTSLLASLALASLTHSYALTADFENFGLSEESHDAGPVPEGERVEITDPFGPDSGLQIQTIGSWSLLPDDNPNIRLSNDYSEVQNPPGTFAYDFWAGGALSNITDNTTPGFANQYSAYPGGGAHADGSVDRGGSYGIVFLSGGSSEEVIQLDNGIRAPQGVYISNTTYAALAMENGEAPSRAFAQGDYFQLVITGLDPEGKVVGQQSIFLADFRSSNAEEHYILDDWAWVPLDSLSMGEEAGVAALSFQLYSSDVGDFGINTPTYFALDQLTATATALIGALPDPSGWSYSPWMGWYYDAELPWLYHEGLGWVFLESGSTASDVLLHESTLGWLQTNAEDFPWLYQPSSGDWLYYFKGTANPQVFYNQSSGEFIEQ